MRIIFVLFIILGFISCSTKKNDDYRFTNDEYKIYSLVIDSLYYQKEAGEISKTKEPIYVPHNYVLIDSTNSDFTNNIAEVFVSNGISSTELINNLQSANGKRYSLKDYSVSVNNIRLISLDKYKSYYTKTRQLNDGGMRGFIEFSKDYPHTYGTSVIEVTRVGFTNDNKSAIVGTMHLRGINMGYDFCYLEKAGDKWIIKKIINH